MGSEKKCCCHRTKERTEEEYKKLIHRLNRIEGQVRGIRGMVEKGIYCPDILVQSAAVTAAMNAAPAWLTISERATTKPSMSC